MLLLLCFTRLAALGGSVLFVRLSTGTSASSKDAQTPNKRELGMVIRVADDEDYDIFIKR